MPLAFACTVLASLILRGRWCLVHSLFLMFSVVRATFSTLPQPEQRFPLSCLRARRPLSHWGFCLRPSWLGNFETGNTVILRCAFVLSFLLHAFGMLEQKGSQNLAKPRKKRLASLCADVCCALLWKFSSTLSNERYVISGI